MTKNTVIQEKRICYIAGPGQVIRAHHCWRNGEKYPKEFALTYSSQVEQYCEDTGAKLLIISQNTEPGFVEDGDIIVQNVAKPFNDPQGAAYIINQFLYGINLIFRILKFRSNIVLVNSGSTFFFMLIFFKLFSVKIIPVYHNLLWPKGFPPSGRLARALLWLDGKFLRHGAEAVIGISLECARQISEISNDNSPPFFLIRAQYLKEEFEGILSPPSHRESVFRIIFVGRIIERKGVYDIIDIARQLEDRIPGRVKWDICGDGVSLNRMKEMSAQQQLEDVIIFHGWTNSARQREIYENVHLSIVPTRNNTAEGLAKSAIESILFKRPVLISPVVPAKDEIGNAAVMVKTNDAKSYVEQIVKLVEDEEYYQEKVEACSRSMQSFWNGEYGFRAVLSKVLDS